MDTQDQTITGNDLWIAYDSSLEDIGLGINVILIADAIAYIFPIALIGITVIQIYYSEEASEFLKAVMEGAVGFGFILAYALWIVPAFR